jgi:hypothetical protein
LKYQPGVFKPSEKYQELKDKYEPDPSHSHLLYLGNDGQDQSGDFGHEIKERIAAELHISTKYEAPLIYVVLGGGKNTVTLVQECIKKGAFCVIVKGSGRAADVIAELAQEQVVHNLDDPKDRSRLFWNLNDDLKQQQPDYDYKLQELTTKYLSIVNSKYVKIFDPDTASKAFTSYDDMCKIMRGVAYAPPRNMFTLGTLDEMRKLRHISIFEPIAKNRGLEVKGFFVGAPGASKRRRPPRLHNLDNDKEVAQSQNRKSESLSEKSVLPLSDMFVSMLRHYSADPSAPDVFVTLLISPHDQDRHVPSLIEGIAEASQSCLIWSLVNLNHGISFNVMRRYSDLRMKLKVSPRSSVIAFSDSNLQQQSTKFGYDTKDIQEKLDDCKRPKENDKDFENRAGVTKLNFSGFFQDLFSGIDEICFAENQSIQGEVYPPDFGLKQHVALRLQAESHIMTVHRAAGVYAVCGGDYEQSMSDLQWCCSQRCHLLIFADDDEDGLCNGLVRAVALHKCLLFVANQILELCWKIAGIKFPVLKCPRACSIDYAIAMCYHALEEVNEPDASSNHESLKTQLENVVKQLLPEPTTDNPAHGSALQDSVPGVNKQTSCFTSNRVHDEIEHEAVVPAAGRQEQNALVTRGFELIREYGQNRNDYNLWPVTPDSQGKGLSSIARPVLDRLKQLKWHDAMFKDVQRTDSDLLFQDSVDHDGIMTMVNLIETCSVSVVFTDSKKQEGIERKPLEAKRVAQAILRRSMESPSVALGHPSVDLFGETRLMAVVAMGNKALVDQVLNEPGVDVHYICRCSAHPTAFGMNALLVAVMLQFPDIAVSILNKLLDLMRDPQSTVFLRDCDYCDDSKTQHRPRIIKTVDYIQKNRHLMQDCLSSRHPGSHINTLMFACRWGYAHLLPKFFELIKLQENILKITKDSSLKTKEPNQDLLLAKPFERNEYMQNLIKTAFQGNYSQTDGQTVNEANIQSIFRQFLMGNSLKDLGVDINGRSALHHAVSSGSTTCVKFCMDHGADALQKNVKYSIRTIDQGQTLELPSCTIGKCGDAFEFQENNAQLKIYCGFSEKELKCLHESREFDAHKLKLNPELSSAIMSNIFVYCSDNILLQINDLVEHDRISSLLSSVNRPVPVGKGSIGQTTCKAAFDVALFSWHVHSVLLNRKTVELAHRVEEVHHAEVDDQEHRQDFKKDVIDLQNYRFTLERNQKVMQGCVGALIGNARIPDESAPSAEERNEPPASEFNTSGDYSVASRSCHLVYRHTQKQAYRRTFFPLLLRVGIISIFYIFCSLINSGISPRESRIFTQTYIRSIRDTYTDPSQPDAVKVHTLEQFAEFMSGMEPILWPREAFPVRPVGSIRMSFLFEEKTPCSGLTSGSCSSHYSPLNDGAAFMNSATISLASTEHDVRRAAAADFVEFSLAKGARFQSVKDCGYTYCFNTLALQLRLNTSSGFNSTWSSLKGLLPQLSSLRFVQLGFLLHSPTIEQVLGVRLLFEIQDIADISVHDRFTPMHIAPHTSDQRLWVLQRIISAVLYVCILHRLIWFARRMSHEWHETISSRNITRFRALLTTNYIPKLVEFIPNFFMTFHTFVEVAFCVLGLILLLLTEEINAFMKENFKIGDVPQHPSLFANVDMVTPLLDGNVGRSITWGQVSLELLLSWRRDLMAWTLLMLFATLLKHLERFPHLGPKLRAIISVLRDSVLVVFLGLIFIVSLAYAMSAYVGFSLDTSDKADIAKSSLEIFFFGAFNQILNIDTQTAFAFTRHGHVPDSPSGLAGLYYIFTAVVGNLVLSNLIITVIGDCYQQNLKYNPETDWTQELNRFLGRQLVLQKLEDDLIEKLRLKKKFGFVSLLKLHAFIKDVTYKMPSWCRFITVVIKSPLCTVIYFLALFFERGWSPYGLKLYPDDDELQKLYKSVRIRTFRGRVAGDKR